ncbi:MAG: pantetheine-phosphate adenylyltransferase [Chloroflexi bacterium]|nr:pantetheine-phosphate adenylyltransferase [Chloroflexota bacterium]MCH8194712.1 pantetheine-phosphate adenylyltransferase [Chloroflexota bacterium]MCH8284333.1 pantetheine-phosphate adenylyltransferase [Chloroflexota bacterium]MCI0769847.1 pantetheine-phosphate adenylyltransferase [Chloroflexota bacterium]
MTIALYPGSFDPVTNGHVDIARRAANVFERLIVGVYDAPPKRLLFETEERIDLFQQAVADVANIEIIPYTGLTVHLAKKLDAKVMVRGLRANSDFEHEFEMAMMNRNMDPDIEVVCMMTRTDYQFLSSSLLKEVCSLGGKIDNLVPPHVEEALKRKLRNNQAPE